MATRFDPDQSAFDYMRRQYVDSMLDDLGRRAVAYAKNRAPVGDERNRQPGQSHLRDTIHAEVRDHKLRVRVDSEYGADVELGNRDFPTASGPVNVPAQPFLRPAVYDDLKGDL